MSVQFNHALVLLLTTFLPLVAIQAGNVTYCDESRQNIVSVQNFETSPNPVHAGRPASFKISASTSQPIAGGKVVIVVTLFGMHIHTENRDLCEETSCPISVGNFVLSHTQNLPAITPPGSYKLQLTMQDENNLQLTCISIDLKIAFGSLASDIYLSTAHSGWLDEYIF